MSDQWYISRGGKKYGPYSWEEVAARARKGDIAVEDLLWREGLSNWKQVAQFPKLAGQIPPTIVSTTLNQKPPVRKKRGLKVILIGGMILFIAALIFVLPRLIDQPLQKSEAPLTDYEPQVGDEIYSFGLDTQFIYSDDQEMTEDTASSFGIQSGTLTIDNPQFMYEGVGLQLSSVFLEEAPANLEVKKMVAPKPLPETVVNAYDFISTDNAQYSGLYTITIPYESGDGLIGAGFFNQATNAWEPVEFELDEANRQVVITTEHLSIYASFKLSGEGTRYARIASGYWEASDVFFNRFSDNIHGAVIQELLENEMTPGERARDLGMSVVSDWFTASGAVFEFQGLAYSSEFLSDLSDAMGNVGTAMSLAQLAVDYQKGDQQAVAVGAFNITRDLAIGKWGTQSLKVAMIGVTAIDYSLNKLYDQLITGRKELWFRAYELYYQQNQLRTAKEWFKIVKDIHGRAETLEQFNEMLNNELDIFTGYFWQNEEEVLFYQEQVQKEHAWTGAGYLSEELKNEISAAHKSIILKDTLEPVFRELEKQVRLKQFEEYRIEFNRLRDLLNRRVTLEIQEIAVDGNELQYGGYIVQFGPLAENANLTQWRAKLSEEGYLKGSFTVLGHLLAGAPNEIRLYKTVEDWEANKPELVVEFVLDVPETIVTLGQATSDELLGSWQGKISPMELSGFDHIYVDGEKIYGDFKDMIDPSEESFEFTVEMSPDGEYIISFATVDDYEVDVQEIKYNSNSRLMEFSFNIDVVDDSFVSYLFSGTLNSDGDAIEGQFSANFPMSWGSVKGKWSATKIE